ncbi:MAG TPA: PAS domain S-box protein [Gemmatimonadaceae bacterium]|jgi:PAS domain S-box-containing protein
MLNLDPSSGDLNVPRVADLLNSISDGILVVDTAEWRCRFANLAIETMFPRAQQDAIGLPVWEILGVVEHAGLVAQLKRVVLERRVRVVSSTTADGSRMQIQALPGDATVTLLLPVDHLLRAATRAAADAEARYRTVFEQSPEGIVIYDNERRVVDCNEAFARLMRSSRNRIIGLHIDDLRDNKHRDALSAALSGRVIRFDSPYEATTSGARIWLSGTFAPLRNASGAVNGAIVMVKDRTEQVRTQAALEESEEEYRRLVEHLPEAVFVQIDERIVYANPAAARLLGAADTSGVIGLSLDDLVDEAQRDQIRQKLQEVLEHRAVVAQLEQRYICFDRAGTVDVDVVAIPFRYEGRSAILTIARDINARKRVEARLVQAQHLEGVGLLASSVAHDFNNLLLVILASASMLLEEPANPHLVAQGANEIEAAARRGSALTRQLTEWKRIGTGAQPAYIDLNAVVEKEEPILRRLLSRRITLSIGLSDDVGTIYADPNRIGQALVNLVVNARDAMPDGGTARIETFTTSVLERDKSIRMSLPPGLYTTLAVRDTGIGITEEMKARIFEPFFTTKPVGHGTGLGLAIVADVVKESGGYIAVQSAPGLGTSFLIYWRQATEAPQAA